MNNFARQIAVPILFVVGTCLGSSVAAKAELPDCATILDPDIGMLSWPYPTISPDGKWIAYVSHGFVCLLHVESKAIQRVLEVPRSWTWPHFTVPSEPTPKSGSFGELMRGLSRDDYNKLLTQVTNRIYGIVWAHDSTAISFGVHSYDPQAKSFSSIAYLATVHGEVVELAHHDSKSKTRGVIAGLVTHDRRFLVSTDHEGLLIWDIEGHKPRATCFTQLMPSAASHRWLGIERNSRQLVMVDNEFQVIQRYDKWLPEDPNGYRLAWSPDERFIFWKEKMKSDASSNWDWEGVRMELETGKKCKIARQFIDGELTFTGRGGELTCCGSTGTKTIGYDQIVGEHLVLVPEGNSKSVDLWRVEHDADPPRRQRRLGFRPGQPTVLINAEATLFVLALLDPTTEVVSYAWHFFDRAGQEWSLPLDFSGQDYMQYIVVGFAQNDELVVVYDKSRLFSIPVEALVNENNTKESAARD